MRVIQSGDPDHQRDVWTVDWDTAGPMCVLLSCPLCGCPIRLARERVDDRGLVTPAVVCPVEACRWTDEVRLEGW